MEHPRLQDDVAIAARPGEIPPDYPFVSEGKGRSRFALSPSGAYKVIGNAVPPVLAYHIARRLQALWPLYFEE